MNTKIIIFLALEKLLKDKAFEKITVIEIAQAAHISRATFYRHFEDKFDLANWYYRQKAEEVFQDTSNDSPWHIFYGLSVFMGQEDATFMQVMLNERGQNSFLISSLISFMTIGWNAIKIMFNVPVIQKSALP